MEFTIHFSKYINEENSDFWISEDVIASSEREAIIILKEKHNKNNQKINRILNIVYEAEYI